MSSHNPGIEVCLFKTSIWTIDFTPLYQQESGRPLKTQNRGEGLSGKGKRCIIFRTGNKRC